MVVVKNTYGVSVSYEQSEDVTNLKQFGGSSLDRKKYAPKEKSKEDKLKDLRKKIEQKNETKFRSMSKRTKAKVRSKIIAFAQVHKSLLS